MNTLLKETDLCVLCGMCLPHCPTFVLSGHEAESPRGRISLMQAFARGQLEPDPILLGHLDRCLVCRACERVCPSGVPYGKLIDEARALLAPARIADHQQTSTLRRLLETVSDKPGKLRPLAKNLHLYQKSGTQWLARHSGLLKGLRLDRLEAMLPPVPKQQDFEAYYPSTTTASATGQHGDVILFTGCLSEVLDVKTLQAAIALLNRLGYGVQVPAGQGCCGALHRHNGEPDAARRLAERNLAVFNKFTVKAIIGTASGCTAYLHDYPHQGGKGKGLTLPAPVYDITTFLATLDWPDDVTVRPLRARVAIHQPCSSYNGLRDTRSSTELLSRIPGLEGVTLQSKARCCGAAGSHLITQPDHALALREPVLADIRRTKPDILVSHNLGCALHLANGLDGLRVVHPVILLAEQVL